MAVIIVDFFTQNLLIGLYVCYFFSNSFVNYQSKFVFTILGLIYAMVTLLINFVSLLSRRWSRNLESD